MADIVDDAQEAIEAAEELRRLKTKAHTPIRTGECIECGEPTEFTFCSVDCRDHYEKQQKMKSILGKA